MPSSVFVKTPSQSRYDHLTEEARSRLIENTRMDLGDLPRHASTCYVWPSATCPVGCGHCNFAAPPGSVPPGRHRISAEPEHTISFLNQMGLWKAVLSGGGEPMEEPDFCEHFIAHVDSDELEEIELITSAHFATSDAACHRALSRLTAAWHGRKRAGVRFTVRLSLDWFHVQRLGMDHAERLIRVLGHPDYKDVGFYIRSVLLEGDDTFAELARRVKGRLSPIEDYQQKLLLPDGREILIYLKNLILDGRMTRRRLERLPVSLPPVSTVSAFGQRFVGTDGRHVPARIYNGPSVRQLDGLACVLEDDGSVKILEGNSPDWVPKTWQNPSWDGALSHIYRDPVACFLVEEGPEALGHLISDQYPDADRAAEDMNQLYYLADHILRTADRRLYATIRAVEKQMASGRASVSEEALAAARAVWGEGRR